MLSRGRPCHPGQECKPAINFERDSGVRQRMSPNLPLYKPEFWDKVQDLDVNGNFKDPDIKCYPDGLPRIGAPSKIVQTANEIIFLYQTHNTFRVIPIDGREHDPIRSQDLTYYGDSVGKWEGDTLVIDSVGFTDESWLAWPGYFHTNNMRVVERLRREGNTLTWQATVHDPEVLMQPWTVNPGQEKPESQSQGAADRGSAVRGPGFARHIVGARARIAINRASPGPHAAADRYHEEGQPDRSRAGLFRREDRFRKRTA